MPMAVFLVGTLFGTEQFTSKRMANMVVVTIGVAIAAYGELNFVLIGVVLQLISIAVEATRLTMVQVRLVWSYRTRLPDALHGLHAARRMQALLKPAQLFRHQRRPLNI